MVLSVLTVTSLVASIFIYLFIQCSWAGLKTKLRLLKQLREEAPNEQNHIIHLVAYSKLWFRKQFSIIDQELEKMDSSLIKTGLAAVREEYTHDDLKTVMAWRAEREQQTKLTLKQQLENCERNLLNLGLINGVVALLLSSQFADETSTVGSILLPCLCAILAALLIQTLVFNPLIEKLSTRIAKESRIAALSIEGVSLIHEKKTPAMIRELLESMALGADIRAQTLPFVHQRKAG